MLGKLKTYLTAGAAFVAVFLYALLKRKEAQIQSEKADRAKRIQRLQAKITDAYIEGQKKYREKVSKRILPGRFS